MSNNTAIILILLAIGLFYTFTNDQYQVVKGLHALATEYQDSLKNVSTIAELRDNLLITYEKFPQDDIDRLSKILPGDNDSVRLALDLDTIAARHGIAIENIQTSTAPFSTVGEAIVADNDLYSKVTAQISFVSNYDNFMGFITDLERNLRIMNIKDITFDVADSELYDHKITLETYWLK